MVTTSNGYMVNRDKGMINYVKAKYKSYKNIKENEKAYPKIGEGLMRKEFSPEEIDEFGPAIDSSGARINTWNKARAIAGDLAKKDITLKLAKEYVKKQREKFNSQH